MTSFATHSNCRPVLLMLIVVAAPAMLVPTVASARCEVLASHYDIKVPEDPGSVTVLLRNAGQTPVRGDRLLLDGTPLPCDGVGEGLRSEAVKSGSPADRIAATRIVWARLHPNPIPPGRSALLTVQFRRRPPYAFRLALLHGDAPLAECRLFPVKSLVRIMNVAFTKDLSSCCVYVENASAQAERILSVEVNDADVTERTWLSAKTIAPGGKELITIARPAVRLGQDATVLLRFESGARICARVRALPVFPVVLERRGPDRALGTEVSQARWERSHNEAPLLNDHVAVVRVFDCPSHVMGTDWQAAAAETLRRRAAIVKRRPGLPVYSHVCRASPDLACPSFAHTTDAGFLNPYLPRYSRTRPPEPLDAIVRALQLVRRANAPGPFYCLAPTNTFGDEKRPAPPDELRRTIYAVLACGARGLVYRTRRVRPSGGRAATLKECNATIRKLAPLLLIAEPVDWASSSSKQLAARALVAGRGGLLLFLLNAGTEKGGLTAVGPAEATVRVPPWLGQLRVSPESDAFHGTVEIGEGQISVKVEQLASACVLVFRPDHLQGKEAQR